MHLVRTCTRFLLLATLLALAACVYRVNIQQGNFLDPAALEQLAPGMTRSQVRFLLGTPMVSDVFDQDRWDYVFYMKRGRLREPEQRKVTVFFEDDKVTRIVRPGESESRVAKSEDKTE
jgi:outer membrane protein assembly factor BamE